VAVPPPGQVYAAGNWSGVAHIVIELTDPRPGHNAAFSLRLYAERVTPNNWDNLSGLSVANDAWGEINPRIAAFLDAAVSKLIREQSPAAAARR
jgi:hypothetical protein